MNDGPVWQAKRQTAECRWDEARSATLDSYEKSIKSVDDYQWTRVRRRAGRCATSRSLSQRVGNNCLHEKHLDTFK
jgi:hypothetical protein